MQVENIHFNSNPVKKAPTKNIWECFLIVTLILMNMLKKAFNKTSKSIGLIRKLRFFLPRPSLLQINKSFVRPHLDYGDIICDKVFIGSFQKMPESI